MMLLPIVIDVIQNVKKRTLLLKVNLLNIFQLSRIFFSFIKLKLCPLSGKSISQNIINTYFTNIVNYAKNVTFKKFVYFGNGNILQKFMLL